MADLPPNAERIEDTDAGLDRGAAPGTPRWVKVFGVVTIALAVLFIIVMVAGGEHGPGRHLSPGGGPGGKTSALVSQDVYTRYAAPLGHSMLSSVTERPVRAW